MTELTLKYWNGRGLAEVARVMLAIDGKFPGKGYTDERFDAPPTEGLDANLGRLPILNVTTDGVTTSVGQSKGIYQYVASVTGLLGSTPLEGAQIITFAEHMTEMNLFFSKTVPYGTVPTDEAFVTLFDDATATDYTGVADGKNSSKRNILWYASRMEHIVGKDGFAVGGKLSLADVLIFSRFGECLPEAGNEKVAKTSREPFGSLERTQKLLAQLPNLSKIVATVANHPNVVKWLAMRGPQGF